MRIAEQLYISLLEIAERKQSLYITTSFLVSELIRHGYRDKNIYEVANNIYGALEAHPNVTSDPIEDCLVID
jgi:hypothetical protein